MTPKKNKILSRVRTTLADCQEVDNEVIRLDSCIGRVKPMCNLTAHKKRVP
jgi:hypothetical protein